MTLRRLMLVLVTCGGVASPSAAVGALISSCTLTLTTGGRLAMSGDGMTMGSQVDGGASAVMAVVGVALTPKLTFSPVSVTGPTGWSGAPTSYLAVSSLSGLNIPYTATTFSITPGILVDTLTFNARIDNPAGFKAGNYTASSTVTCEAA